MGPPLWLLGPLPGLHRLLLPLRSPALVPDRVVLQSVVVFALLHCPTEEQVLLAVLPRLLGCVLLTALLLLLLPLPPTTVAAIAALCFLHLSRAICSTSSGL
jgi:hypothetical protein